MTKDTTNTIHLGFEPGNRNSVLTAFSGTTLKEKTALDLSAYAPYSQDIFTTEPGSAAVYHNDTLYQVGQTCDGQNGSFNFTSIDKYTDPDGLQILFKSLLTRILPQGKNRVYSANLAVGMPIGWMSERFTESVRENLAGKHEIVGLKNHGTVEIDPKAITFHHEPLAGYIYLRSLPNLEVKEYCNILDIGFDTSDTFTFENGKIVKSKTVTIETGMYDLYADIQAYFQANDMGRRKPIADIESAVLEYKFNNGAGPLDRMVKSFIAQLTNEISAAWKGIRNKENLALIGGGGDFLTPFFNLADIPLLQVPYPQLANSKGLAIIAANHS